MPFETAPTMKNCTEDKQKFDSKSRSKKYLKSSFKTVKGSRKVAWLVQQKPK